MSATILRLGVVCVALLLAGGSALSACSSSSEASASDGGAEAAAQTVPEAGGADVAVPETGPADSGASDTGASDTGPTDGTIADQAAEAAPTASDAGDAGDASTFLVQAGVNLVIAGVTDDGFVVYEDLAQQTYYAKSLTGEGPATALYTISPELEGGFAEVFGKQVFIWGASNDYVSVLVTWSAGLPTPLTLTSTGLASYNFTAWVSDDGKHIAFLQVDPDDPSVGEIIGANADGTNPTLLVSDLLTSNQACFPRVALQGGYAVIASCSAADGGAETIQTFSIAADWSPALSVPNVINTAAATSYNPYVVDSFALDPDAGKLLAASASLAGGALQVFPIGGADGGGTVIDPTAPLSPSVSVVDTTTYPWDVLYNTAGGELKESPTAVPAPQVLVDGGVNDFLSISLDGKWLLVADKAGADVSLVSTQTPGAPLLVAASSESQYHGLPVGVLPEANAGFTRDSSYALFGSDVIVTDNVEVYYFHSMGIASPNPVMLLSTGYAVQAISLPGSKVLLYDNFQVVDGGAYPTIDLAVVDPATSAPRIVIASGVPLEGPVLELNPGSIGVTRDLTKIVYPVLDGASPGIYWAPIP
jgi:hypothetical protein